MFVVCCLLFVVVLCVVCSLLFVVRSSLFIGCRFGVFWLYVCGVDCLSCDVVHYVFFVVVVRCVLFVVCFFSGECVVRCVCVVCCPLCVISSSLFPVCRSVRAVFVVASRLLMAVRYSWLLSDVRGVCLFVCCLLCAVCWLLCALLFVVFFPCCMFIVVCPCLCVV